MAMRLTQLTQRIDAGHRGCSCADRETRYQVIASAATSASSDPERRECEHTAKDVREILDRCRDWKCLPSLGRSGLGAGGAGENASRRGAGRRRAAEGHRYEDPGIDADNRVES